MKKLLVSALAATVLSFGIGSEVTLASAAEPQAVTKSNILTMAAVWKQTAAETAVISLPMPKLKTVAANADANSFFIESPPCVYY